MMRWSPLAAALFVVQPAIAIPAEGATRVCEGHADGESEASVNVRFELNSAGEIVGREADWRPALREGGEALLLRGAPWLAIEYANPSERSLGEPTGLSVFNVKKTRNPNLLSDAMLVFRLPGGRRFTTNYNARPAFNDDGSLAALWGNARVPVSIMGDHGSFLDLETQGWVPAVERAEQVRLTIERRNIVLYSATYDLRGRAERDRLFARAWAEARMAVQSPQSCQEVRPPDS